MENEIILSQQQIESRIFTVRGKQVMIDRDLAEMYRVKVKRLNEQVKRNLERFPDNFCFQLADRERDELVANCDRFKTLKHSSVNPYAFTEQGVAMLSSVLRSDVAVKVSIIIINAFIEMRKLILSNHLITSRLDDIERKQFINEDNFEKIFKALEHRIDLPAQGIFFNGQVFDAYTFAADLIRKADTSLILIDNYIDDSVLSLFCKRKESVKVTIFTRNISKQLRLDLKKFNEQYPVIMIKQFTESHDRFLIIDEKILYHIGASLKDLGKKWFAFSKMDFGVTEIIEKLNMK